MIHSSLLGRINGMPRIRWAGLRMVVWMFARVRWADRLSREVSVPVAMDPLPLTISICSPTSMRTTFR